MTMSKNKITWIGAVLLTATPLFATAQASLADRTIAADMHAVTGARDMFWQDCVGAGHAGLLLRKENQAQL